MSLKIFVAVLGDYGGSMAPTSPSPRANNTLNATHRKLLHRGKMLAIDLGYFILVILYTLQLLKMGFV